MTERRRPSLERDTTWLRIGPSRLIWDGAGLTINIDETAVPLPSRIRGQVRLIPPTLTEHVLDLDPAGRHHWWPIAPLAQVEAHFDRPALRWRGSGYLDSNWGDEPLEDGFVTWTWSRADLGQRAVVLYDVNTQRGGTHFALRFAANGSVQEMDPPPPAPLSSTPIWRIPRTTRADGDGSARVRQTLEDTPFYARSVLETHLDGARTLAIHESLLLERFSAPWVRLLLRFRMPRALR